MRSSYPARRYCRAGGQPERMATLPQRWPRAATTLRALAIWGTLRPRRRGARAGAISARASSMAWALSATRTLALRMADAGGGRLATRSASALLGDFYFNGEDGTPDRAPRRSWYRARGRARATRTLRTCCPGSSPTAITAARLQKQALALGRGLREQGVRRLDDAARPALPQRAGRRARCVLAAASWWRKARRTGRCRRAGDAGRRASPGRRCRARSRARARLADAGPHGGAQSVRRRVLRWRARRRCTPEQLRARPSSAPACRSQQEAAP